MRVIVESIRDLRIYARWLATRWQEVSTTTLWLRETGERLRESLSAIAQRTERLWREGLANGLTEQQILAIGGRELDNARRTFAASAARRALAPSESEVEVADPDKAALMAPSLTLMAAIMFGIARVACLQPHTRRPPKASDAGDMTHCLYLPHVDLFRADTFVADVIKKNAPEYYRRVVPSLRELPARIAEFIR
jgi:hypothetical protein